MTSVTRQLFLGLLFGGLCFGTGMTASAASEPCPEGIDKLKNLDFLTAQFKWKAPATKEGESAPLPDFQCKKTQHLSVAGAQTPVYALSLKGQKKTLNVLVPEQGDAVILRSEPKLLEEANAKVFSTALPLARSLTIWKKILLTNYEIQGNDFCAKTTGPAGVLKGAVVTCAKTSGKSETTEKITLDNGILSPAKAQQLALKEFARIEKEEETPDVKEIFEDKDTVWKLYLGNTPAASYYVFWMSQFSASGVIVMAAYMDGSVKSDVLTNAFEYDAKLVNARLQKWAKERTGK